MHIKANTGLSNVQGSRINPTLYIIMNSDQLTMSDINDIIKSADDTTLFTGPHWNIAVTFGMEKLEWCGCPMVKKSADTFSRFDTSTGMSQMDILRQHSLHSIEWLLTC